MYIEYLLIRDDSVNWAETLKLICDIYSFNLHFSVWFYTKYWEAMNVSSWHMKHFKKPSFASQLYYFSLACAMVIRVFVPMATMPTLNRCTMYLCKEYYQCDTDYNIKYSICKDFSFIRTETVLLAYQIQLTNYLSLRTSRSSNEEML